MSGLLVFVLLAQPAEGQQPPGLAELAAGLGCWENLDSACAVTFLKQALEKLNPGQDENYLDHVTQARWTLAQVYLAADDLVGAEQQLGLLLSLNPDFTLPPGDHPPKLIYVYEQAREQMLRQKKKAATRPKIQEPAPPAPAAAPPVALPTSAAIGQDLSAGRPTVLSRRWFFEVLGKAEFVFGADSRTLYPAGGLELSLGWKVISDLALGLSVGWSRHHLRQEPTALQQFRLGFCADFYLPVGNLEPALRLQLAATAMGTKDRYDHFGALLDFGVGMLWKMAESLVASAWLLPEAVILENGVSFRLVLALGLRLPW